MTTLVEHLRIQARANRLANHRLHAAMAPLSREDFHAPRTSFFPSLAQTLNHILAVDLYYIAALYREADMAQQYQRVADAPLGTLAELAQAQRTSDERLIALCERLDAEGADAFVDMNRSEGRVQRDRASHVLQHVFMHQTHHRGQVHAMLSGTAVAPPQLDEFIMPSDAPFRVADMAQLHWSEDRIYGLR